MKIAFFYLFLSFFITGTGVYTSISLKNYFYNSYLLYIFFGLTNIIAVLLGLFFFILSVFDYKTNKIR